MSFVIVEFSVTSGGGLAIVNKSWLTPRKTEVNWPPYKSQAQYNRALKNSETPDNNWEAFQITRCFYSTDDYDKVHKKLIECELTSDIQSDNTDSEQPLTRRKHSLPQRYIDSEDEECQTSSQLSRPPKVRRLLFSTDDGQVKSQQNGTPVAVIRNSNLTQINESSPRNSNCDIQKSITPTASRTLDSLNINEDLIHRLISIQESCLSAVTHVKEQNKQILNYLTQQEKKQSSPFPVRPEILTPLPLSTEEDLTGLNQLLSENQDINSALCTYLGTLGGKDITNKTNRILKYILTDEVAQNYNYFGKRSKKKAFCELQLNDVIIRAVKAGTNCNNKEVEDLIKVWLKHAPERLKAIEKRQHKTNN